MTRSGFVGAVSALILIISTGCALLTGHVGSSTVACRPLISYQGKTFKITTLNTPWKVSIGDLTNEPKSLQTAADIAQILDIARVDRCEILNRLNPNDPDYAAQLLESQRASEAIASLAIIMGGRQRAQQPDGQTEVQLANWISAHIDKASALKASTPKTQEIPLTQDLEAAKQQSPQLRASLEKFQGRGRALEVWDFLKEEQKTQIVQFCREVVGLFSTTLSIPPADLKANIFIQGQDGYLYIPPGLVVNMVSAPIIRIPLHYGSSGVAYAEGKEQITEIMAPGQPVTFLVGDGQQAEESQAQARRILLPPDEMSLITASWVVSIPIKNAARQVIAVLNITSTVQKTEQELRSAFSAHRGEILTLGQQIASQLVL